MFEFFDHLWSSFAIASLPIDASIDHAPVIHRDSVVTSCTLNHGNPVEYIFRLKTAPVSAPPPGQMPRTTATEGLLQVRLHGSLDQGSADNCSGWIPLKKGFAAGKSLELSIVGPDVGHVRQVDLKNENDQHWKPAEFIVKRLVHGEPWVEFHVGKNFIGAPDHKEVSLLPEKTAKLIDTATGTFKLNLA